jgi:hypothetical protein
VCVLCVWCVGMGFGGCCVGLGFVCGSVGVFVL